MVFIAESFFSGCISKVINDGKDYSWTKIKSVINDKNNCNLSTKIYRVIENALNIVTDKKFKGTDILYEAIEKIYIEFRDNESSIESVKCGLGLLGSDASDQRCENFLEKFYEEIHRDDDLYKAVNIILQQNGIRISQEEFRKINEKLDNLTDIVSSRNNNKIDILKREPVKSRTQEYADKWNQNMFLNNFDKRDENAGVNVTLSEVYLEEHLPHYIWGSGKNTRDDLKDLLKEYNYPHNENKMLVILGQPGIGKSTLITWITANFTNRVDDILVYKFASDLEDIDWQNSKVSNHILEKLGFEYKDLNGKTLILDGLDEVNIDDRCDVLENLYGDWIYRNHVEKFSLIITCRENYVQELNRIKSRYIILQSWDEMQIKSFCDVFEAKTGENLSQSTIENLIKNRKILGIPLILYMTLALNISIEKEGSIVDIYDKIFSLDGGIYDRCINNKNFADRHRIGEVKEYIHQVSRDIAIWIFENKSNEAYIPQEEYQRICNDIVQKQQDNKIIQQDFLIGNFFKLVRHCEVNESKRLYFVHRSIYEYFVVETIYTSVFDKIDISKEELAGVFGKLFKRGKLTHNILDYLQYKIIHSKLNNMFDIVNETFQLMLQDGMTYYTRELYKNIIECEMCVFTNMLEIIHLWKNNFTKLRLSNSTYLKHEASCPFNLSRMDLKEADLIGAKLRYTDLRYADLTGAKLKYADLRHADLRGARLVYSDFQVAYLKNLKLEGAELSEEQVEVLERKGNLYGTKVYINETQKIISYEEYQKRDKNHLLD